MIYGHFKEIQGPAPSSNSGKAKAPFNSKKP